MTVHHYMVDFEDEDGVVRFANNAFLHSLDEAMKLARRTSLETESAAVVAFEDVGDGTFKGVGHVCYYRGQVSDVDGVTK